MRLERRVVIVGAGHAGGRAALQLRAAGFTGEVILVGEEPELPYERPPLSKDFLLTEGRTRHAPLALRPEWDHSEIQLRLTTRAVALDPQAQTVQMSDGSTLQYDQVVLATGASARQLRVEGSDDPAVLSLRNISDASVLRTRIAAARRMIVVGGGVIGLEVAAVARKKGIEVDVVEAGDRLMGRVVPPLISSWIAELHETRGVRVHCGTGVQSFERTAAGELRTTLSSATGQEQCLRADFVLVAIGITPRTDWLESSGLPLSSGVVVDSFCRSPINDTCYAIGDVASTWHAGYGRSLRQETWRNADNQGRAVAEFLCGRTKPYVETPWMWSDQYGNNLQMLGLPQGADRFVTRGTPKDGAFSVIGLRDKVVVNAALINRARDRRPLESLMVSGLRVDPDALADQQNELRRLSA